MKVIHFGAGKIGRGLIYPLMSARFEVTLVDSNRNLVDGIRKNEKYSLHVVKDGEERKIDIKKPNITHIDDVSPNEGWDLITTSVIEKNLNEILPAIERIVTSSEKAIYVVPMENSLSATRHLRERLSIGVGVGRNVRVLGSVIDRIISRERECFGVECEEFSNLTIEYEEGLRERSQNFLHLTNEIAREQEKKLLLVNGLHACTAYLGYTKRLEFIYEVMKDAELSELVHDVAECYVDYMSEGLGYDRKDIKRIAESSLVRFANPLLDPLARVGRSMVLKLGKNERIMKPLEYNKEHNLKYKSLEKVVWAARHFKIGNDYEEYLKSLD